MFPCKEIEYHDLTVMFCVFVQRCPAAIHAWFCLEEKKSNYFGVMICISALHIDNEHVKKTFQVFTLKGY
jgi:hypothetical protein